MSPMQKSKTNGNNQSLYMNMDFPEETDIGIQLPMLICIVYHATCDLNLSDLSQCYSSQSHFWDKSIYSGILKHLPDVPGLLLPLFKFFIIEIY